MRIERGDRPGQRYVICLSRKEHRFEELCQGCVLAVNPDVFTFPRFWEGWEHDEVPLSQLLLDGLPLFPVVVRERYRQFKEGAHLMGRRTG